MKRLSKNVNNDDFDKLLKQLQMIVDTISDPQIKQIGLMVWESFENNDIDTARSLFSMISPDLRKLESVELDILGNPIIENLRDLSQSNMDLHDQIFNNIYPAICAAGAILDEFDEYFNGTNTEDASTSRKLFIIMIDDAKRDVPKIIERIKGIMKLYEV